MNLLSLGLVGAVSLRLVGAVEARIIVRSSYSQRLPTVG